MGALAKDGTNRGGYRVGAGRKKKPLAEKILDGQVAKPGLKPVSKPDGKTGLEPGAGSGVESVVEPTSALKSSHGIKHDINHDVSPDTGPSNRFPPSPDIDETDIPEPRDFINAEQKGLAGVSNESRAIYDDTMKWLAERGCAEVVPRGLVEKYAVATARWEQCDKLMSMGGITGKHPTTGAQIASPFVSMSLHWLKQANQQWHLIEAKVQEHCGDDVIGAKRTDPMEQILNGTYRRREGQ